MRLAVAVVDQHAPSFRQPILRRTRRFAPVLLIMALVCASFAAGAAWQRRRTARDPYAVEPLRLAWPRLAEDDSVKPPRHSTAMCADGWYTFARVADRPCYGHGGVRLRTDRVFTGDEWAEWVRVKDSLTDAIITGRTDQR